MANAGIGFVLSDYVRMPCELSLGSLGIENLTDEYYAFQPGYPMPGRTVFFIARLGSG